MKRVLTYDIKQGNDYAELYDWFNEVKAKQLTESVYEINSNLVQKDFENKVKDFIKKGDNFWYISVDAKSKLFAKKVTKE